MKKLLKILDFFRLLDETGTLSLTNIAVIIVLAKLALEKTIDYTAIAALLTVLSTYSFKRYTQRKERFRKEAVAPASVSSDQILEVSAGLAELEDRVSDINSDIDRIRLAVGMTNVKVDGR